MFRFASTAILVATLLIGCSAGDPPSLPVDHPANPDAAEAPLPPRSRTLSLSEAAPVGPAFDQPGSSRHAGHDDDVESPKAEDGDTASKQPHHEHEDHAVTPKPGVSATQSAEQAIYTCSMDPEVVSDKPGKCPKCGMKLIKKKQPDAEHGGQHEH